MGRRKRKLKAPEEQPPAKQVKPEIVKVSEDAVIKRSLRKSCKDDDGKLRQEIERIVIEMTRTLKAGSLNLHVSLYHLFNTGTRNQIETEFKTHVGKNDQFFSDYFRGLQMINDEYTGYILNPTVKRLCLEYEISPPKIQGIGNVYNYSIKKYHINFMNNICIHAYNRIRKFFYARTRCKKRIYDTLHYLFHTTSGKTPDMALINAIKWELQPIDFGNGLGYFFGMDSKWYRYVPMFMALQK